MKKLLVLTDYSTYADRALKYAIQMAKTIKADIHVCHAITVPELSQQADLVVWPLETYENIKKESDEKLKSYVDSLGSDKELAHPYLPQISYSTEVGMVKQVVDLMIASQKIDLVVMGMAGAGNLNRFFLGSNSRNIIEKTKVPVLLIPRDTAYSPLEKLGFASDLHKSDINSIHQLTELFYFYNPMILLVHIHKEETADNQITNEKVNAFLKLVTCKINYAKIYYRHIDEDDIEKGLKWLGTHTQIDMLVMVHRELSLYKRIINGSYTQKIAKTTTLPLLVMPVNE